LVTAVALAVLASLTFIVSANVAAYAMSFVAGLITAWVVHDRRRALIGLIVGIAASFAAWGAIEVMGRIEACGNRCGGLSSPSLTAWIVVAFGLIGLALALGGYAAGRVIRRVVGRAADRQAA
jgi:hypothetical protein